MSEDLNDMQTGNLDDIRSGADADGAGNADIPDMLAPAKLRPSQLYLNAEKLAAVLDRVGDGRFNPGSLPVYRFDGDLHLVDGHTRAFVAYLVGCETVAVEYDAALPKKHDVALYRECLDWCADAGVERVSDFTGRVLGPTVYEREWVERCHRAGRRLDEE